MIKKIFGLIIELNFKSTSSNLKIKEVAKELIIKYNEKLSELNKLIIHIEKYKKI